MRIYCLSKFEEIEPDENLNEEIVPYEDEADEKVINLWGEYSNLSEIKKTLEILQFYGLTEISVGFLEVQGRKIFAMYIYRKEFGVLKIKMVRGAVKLQKGSDVFDLLIANSELLPKKLCYNLRIRICCIKNTSTKGIISEEEENIYSEYERQILECCNRQPDLQDEALKKLKFVKHNTSTEKVYKERINNFTKLIDYLCDPKTGSYKSVPTSNTRLYQEVEILLYNGSNWSASKPRKDVLDKQAKNFRDCESISWLKVDLSKLTLQDTKMKKLRTLQLAEVNFLDSDGKIQKCFEHLDFTNLETASIKNCNIKMLTKEFFEKMPSTLLTLFVQENDIVYIDPSIAKLKKLRVFYVSRNSNLSDSGIPWENLPPTIAEFKLEMTNITKIPSDIQRLSNLFRLHVSSDKLTHVDWKAISPTIELMYIQAGGHLNDIILNREYRLRIIDVSNAGLTNIDCSMLPESVNELILCNNKLETFDPGHHLPHLRVLSLKNNNLKSIEWRNITPALENLFLDNNELESIGNISHLKSLWVLTANFNRISSISEGVEFLPDTNVVISNLELRGNEISKLPSCFKYFSRLTQLNLAHNHFNCTEQNLEEDLWKRLPTQKHYEFLNLDNNNLGELPCMLRNIPIVNLHVKNCNIKYMCPHLFGKSNALQNDRLCPHWNLRLNPIQFLPFIPLKIFQPISKEEMGKPIDDMYTVFNKEKPRLHLMMNDDGFVVTSKFPMASKKPKYEFKTFGEKTNDKNIEPNFRCKCCAKCGNINDENMPDFSIIEQLMVMDYVLSFDQPIKEIPRIYAGQTQKEALNLQNLNTVVETKELFYCSGKWKANVVTRLCTDCIILLKAETDEAFEIHRKKLKKDEEISSKKIRKKVEETQNILVQDPTIELVDPTLHSNLPANYGQNLASIPDNLQDGISDCQQYFYPQQIVHNSNVGYPPLLYIENSVNQNFDYPEFLQHSFPPYEIHPAEQHLYTNAPTIYHEQYQFNHYHDTIDTPLINLEQPVQSTIFQDPNVPFTSFTLTNAETFDYFEEQQTTFPHQK